MADVSRRLPSSSLSATLLILLGWLLVVVGYWGPWAWAEPAGLRVLGLDLAEYSKFVAEVRSGQITVLREVFYLPLLALSLSLSLLAHRPELQLPRVLRWTLNLLAVPAALAMLPPAWTPPLLATPEFVKQSIAIVTCLLAAALSYPLLRRLPPGLVAVLLALLAVTGIILPVASFVSLTPALDDIYGHAIPIGRGPWQTSLGLTLIVVAWVLAVRGSKRRPG